MGNRARAVESQLAARAAALKAYLQAFLKKPFDDGITSPYIQAALHLQKYKSTVPAILIRQAVRQATTKQELSSIAELLCAQRCVATPVSMPLSLQFLVRCIAVWPASESDLDELNTFVDKTASSESNHAIFLSSQVIVAGLDAIGQRGASEPWIRLAFGLLHTAHPLSLDRPVYLALFRLMTKCQSISEASWTVLSAALQDYCQLDCQLEKTLDPAIHAFFLQHLDRLPEAVASLVNKPSDF